MRLIFIISFLLLNWIVNAQRIKSEYVISKADSILLFYVGNPIANYFNFSYNNGSYYSYKNKFGKFRTGSIKENVRTKGTFINANIRYTFGYPDIKGIEGSTFVSFNSKYEIVEKLDLEYIPEFLKQGKPCNFISEITAAKISLDSLNFRGLDIEGPLLKYNFTFNRYVYTINNYIKRECCIANQDYGIKEVIIIDAITGQIIHHRNENFGILLIR